MTANDIPPRLGRYEIVERLSSGGMGEVFVARFAGPGGFIKPVALKRIHPHLAGDETFIAMLHDEANVAAAIRHPNIVATIDVGFDQGNHFVVLDYVSGDPLDIVHRDVSLGNIMLSDAGHPMLFDFGVAKAKQRFAQTSHGELKGKL